MKKGIVYSCLAPNLEMHARFQLAAEAGYQGVEIPGSATTEQMLEFKAAATAVGVTIPSIMAGTHWSHPLSSNDAATRQHTIEAVARNFEQARAIGADVVLVVPGVVDEETTYEAAWQNSLASIKQLAPIAEMHNVTMALENVWNKFLLSPLEFTRFLDEIDSPWVKAYFDCGNILAYGYPQQWIESLGQRIARVHVKDFRMADRQFVHLLQGDVPWKKVMPALRAIDYDSFLTVELPPYVQSPEQMVFDCSHALDRIFAL